MFSLLWFLCYNKVICRKHGGFTLADKYEALKQYFGYTVFRKGQEELVDGILAGRDVFGVMPTGAGKSLCFQLPALMLEGITLVISPLISLMKDQVNSLNQAGIRAAYLNSSLTAGQYRLALERARQSTYKMIYVAPERLLTDEFQRFAQGADISMISVDEAHCVSQWGQDFRPSYLKIHEFIAGLKKRPVISAFTATATALVREDVVRLLELRAPVMTATGFDRSNLYFAVEKPRDKFVALLRFWRENEGKSGVVYCSTRKTVEEVCERLCGEGCPATRYHAGLSDAERLKNQDDFIFDRVPVMVATNAFGMGIDKSNVGFVVHYNMPKDMESYYQEAGRAGRDGEAAHCVLFYSGQDVRTNQYFIEHSRENEELDEETRTLMIQRDRERLKAMTFYCFTGDCLRAYILRYFGEHIPGFCGNCGNCVRSTEEADITLDAQKILSCIKRTGERFGAKLIVAVLRGGRVAQGDERVLKYGLDTIPTYGVMADVAEAVLYDEIRFLERDGYLVTSDDEYRVLGLAEKAGEILFQGKTLRMKLPKGKEPDAPKRTAAQIRPANPQLFDKLKKLRAKLAGAKGVPAYIIFSDATLRDMCARMPRTRAELLEVNGVGAEKAERYGERFLSAIAEQGEEGRP
jgi:ATP-dependent DNA helicase RecQ